MYSVSRLARRFCATLAASPAAISGEAAASVPTKAKKNPSVYKKLQSLGTRGGKMEETLNQFVMEGVPVKKHELIRYAKHLGKFCQPQRALEIFEWMERKEIVFTGSDHAIRLDLIARTKGLEAAEFYFNSLDDSIKNQSTYGSLLNCYCLELEEDKAKAHFENMVDLNHVSNSLPFNNLMAMYLQLGQPEKVLALVVVMKQKNITPCYITFSMWGQSCGSLKDLDGVDSVEKVLDFKMNAEVEVLSSWDTFANLAAIYIKVGLYDKAEEALKSLENKMNPHIRDCYHFLISLYAGIANATEVYRVWDLLKKRHPYVNNSSYLTMLQALSKLNDIDGIKKIFTEWESTCWTYDMRMANVTISSYLKQNMYEEAEAVFNGAMKKDQVDLALKHFKAAVLDLDKNLTWSSELISSFFLHFEEAKDVDGAEAFCKTLTKWSLLGSETYTLLMKTYLSAGKACPDMKQRLEEQGIQVDEEQECLLSKICA